MIMYEIKLCAGRGINDFVARIKLKISTNFSYLFITFFHRKNFDDKDVKGVRKLNTEDRLAQNTRRSTIN